MGLRPTLADTDGDTLDDATELAENFSPFDTNSDGDHRDDAVEYEKESDPFYYNKVGLEYARDVGSGFLFGDAGQNFSDMGLFGLSENIVQSFGYLSGWLASGFAVIGDIRDTLASLIRGDLVDTFLNALGLAPLAGDLLKTVKVFATFISWSEDLLAPVARWITFRFPDNPNLMFAALGAVKWGDDMPIDNELKRQLAASRNSPEILGKAIKRGDFTPVRKSASKAELDDTIKNGTFKNSEGKTERLWDVKKLGDETTRSGKTKWAEARAVEAAAKTLRDEGYEILYVGRNQALKIDPSYSKSKDGRKHLSNGPDVVAVKRDEAGNVAELAVGEIKGSSEKVSINSETFRSDLKANGKATSYTQPSLEWLIESERSRSYLETMGKAVDPKIREAGVLLERARNGDEPYDALLLGYGQKETTVGTLDQPWKGYKGGGKVDDRASAYEQLNPQGEGTRSGVRNVKAYVIEPQQ